MPASIFTCLQRYYPLYVSSLLTGTPHLQWSHFQIRLYSELLEGHEFWGALFNPVELPRRLSGKESTCQCRRHRFHPWVGKIPLRRKWQSTPVLLPGKFHGQKSLVGYSPWCHKELDTTEWLHFFTTRAKKPLKKIVNTHTHTHTLWGVSALLILSLCCTPLWSKCTIPVGG